jgi:acid phosphatase (class A)
MNDYHSASTFRSSALALLIAVGCFSGAPACAAQPAMATRPQTDLAAGLPSIAFDSVPLIGPPPAAGSEAERRDVAAVLATQHAAQKDGTLARAIADAEDDCGRVADVLAPAAPAAPGAPGLARAAADRSAALAFATAVSDHVSMATAVPKRHFHRPRPFLVSAEVARYADIADPGRAPTAEEQLRDNTSYPSGHGAFGAACAMVLAQMVPEQAQALFQRGRDFGTSRIIVGAHFPTDIEAGRTFAAVAMAQVLASPAYAAGFGEARMRLRRSLGLPATN